MRKAIIGKLTKGYIKTFPPITKNKKIGSIKRAIILFVINIIGGKDTKVLVNEIAEEIANKNF